VSIDLGGVSPVEIDWEGPQGRGLVEGVYQRAYALLGEAS
jgi:hypothetical protein